MFWADRLLQDRKGSEWVNDAWTPSGIIHMGGLKGPVIHDTLYKIIKQQGRKVKFSFGFDDFDPIDGLPKELQKSHFQYMGVPIFMVPSPDGKGSFGEFYGNKMRSLLKSLGIGAEIYLASEYYKKGVYNEAVKIVLDRVEKVRKVYEDMYKKPVKKDWYPFQVICPKCNKLGTTKVIDWDGEKVTFLCEPNMVEWAKGCGYKGKISPFNGNGKMPYKVEWAAKWATFGVTIEGAGKDHTSAGGTYDVAINICRQVFEKEPPLKISYEFFLSGGKKMSSSKGVGLNGEGLLNVMPPEIVRFLMIRTPPNQAVEFSPFGTNLFPRLYDEYQRAGDAYFNKLNHHSGKLRQMTGRIQNLSGQYVAAARDAGLASMTENVASQSNEDLTRVFELSQVNTRPPASSPRLPKHGNGGQVAGEVGREVKKPPKVRFSVLSQWVQMPNMEENIKREGLEEWAKYARIWVERYAPESEKFIVSKQMPSAVKKLSEKQKTFLQKIGKELDKKWEGDVFQKDLYEWAKELNLSSKDAFAAIYISLIGKDHGPKAAWLILSLDKKFVKKRFEETANMSLRSGFA